MPVGTWFITGCSSGLGRALAERLLATGQRVAATARDVNTLRDLAPAGTEQLWLGRLDVTDHAEIRRCVDAAFGAFGRIDVVVSNAGYGLFGAAEEVSDEQIHRQLMTNLVGPIQVARAALPHLRAQGSGRLVQISSMGGQSAMAGMSLYNASKWGAEGFFEALALEVAGFGIEVTIVEPGSVRTRFSGSSRDAVASPSPAYHRTPAGVVRRAVERGMVSYTGSLDKMVAAIIDAATRVPGPRRVVLGGDSYREVHAALSRRLAEVTAQRDRAHATDLRERS